MTTVNAASNSTGSTGGSPEAVWQARLTAVITAAASDANAPRIPRRHASALSPAAFGDHYLLANKPVLITGLIEHWRAAREWVQHIPIERTHAPAAATATINNSNSAAPTAAAAGDSSATAVDSKTAPNSVTAAPAVAIANATAALTATSVSAAPAIALEAEHRITLKPRKKDIERAAAEAAARAAGTTATANELTPTAPVAIAPVPVAAPTAPASAASTVAVPAAPIVRSMDDYWHRPTQLTPIPCDCNCGCAICRSAHPTAASTTVAATAALASCCRARPNFNFLIARFGDAIVPVAHCAERSYSDQKRENLSLAAYLSGWRTGAYDTLAASAYAKDWHFMRQFPAYGLYDCPPHFADDWMNAFCDSYNSLPTPAPTPVDAAAPAIDQKSPAPAATDSGAAAAGGVLGRDDYRFVYAGPALTWTPLHRDVFASYSWSVNICGRKLWLLFPPAVAPHLFDSFGNVCYNILEPIAPEEEAKTFPRLCDARRAMIVCVQSAGETIFVPSGWYHQVHNLDDVISINHNWLNGAAIDKMHAHLIAEMKDVQHAMSGFDFTSDIENVSIDDTDDGGSDSKADKTLAKVNMESETQCQTVLKANAGMNMDEFYRFCTFHSLRLIDELQRVTRDTPPQHTRMIRLSLTKLSRVLTSLQSLPYLRCVHRAEQLLHARTRELIEAQSARLRLQQKQLELARQPKVSAATSAAAKKAAKKASKKQAAATKPGAKSADQPAEAVVVTTAAAVAAASAPIADSKTAESAAPAPAAPTGDRFIAPALDSLLRFDIASTIELAIKAFQAKQQPPVAAAAAAP